MAIHTLLNISNVMAMAQEAEPQMSAMVLVIPTTERAVAVSYVGFTKPQDIINASNQSAEIVALAMAFWRSD